MLADRELFKTLSSSSAKSKVRAQRKQEQKEKEKTTNNRQVGERTIFSIHKVLEKRKVKACPRRLFYLGFCGDVLERRSFVLLRFLGKAILGRLARTLVGRVGGR